MNAYQKEQADTIFSVVQQIAILSVQAQRTLQNLAAEYFQNSPGRLRVKQRAKLDNTLPGMRS